MQWYGQLHLQQKALTAQLIRFDRIRAVCVGRSPNGNFVKAMKLLDKEVHNSYVYTSKIDICPFLKLSLNYS